MFHALPCRLVPPPKKLARALIDEADGSFHLTLEIEGGEIVKLLMTEDQLDGLANEIDEALSAEDPGASG